MKNIGPYDKNLVLLDRDFLPDSWGDFFKDFGRLENSVFKAHGRKNSFEPTCDITEAKDHYMICLDVPGVEKNNLNIEVEDGQLKISGERHKETSEKDSEQRQVYFERSFGKFVRTFNLPKEINSEDIQAHYQDGVLKIAVPKVKKTEPKKVLISSDKPSLFQKLVGSEKE